MTERQSEIDTESPFAPIDDVLAALEALPGIEGQAVASRTAGLDGSGRPAGAPHRDAADSAAEE